MLEVDGRNQNFFVSFKHLYTTIDHPYCAESREEVESENTKQFESFFVDSGHAITILDNEDY